MSGIEEESPTTEDGLAEILAQEMFGAPEDPNLETQVGEPGPIPPIEDPAETEIETPVEEPEVETPVEEPVVVEAAVEPASEEEPEPEFKAWARKQFGEDLDLDNPQIAKIAESRYEAERMIGRSQSELAEQRQRAEEVERQQRISSLTQKGNLTAEESDWVDMAVESEDPAAFAISALENDRRDLYAEVLDRWGVIGTDEGRRARDLHARVVTLFNQPAPDPQQEYADAMGETFQTLGLSVVTHGPVILSKAADLGESHHLVQAMMSPDPQMRALAVRSVWDLAQQTSLTVQKVVREDEVEARVAEERLRDGAAVVGNGTLHQTQPKQGTFWDEFDSEVAARGWDGARPSYQEQR